MKLVYRGLLALILLLPVSIFAAEGRIPIGKCQIPPCNITIDGTNNPAGSYILTDDFLGTITIDTDHVSIDLGGHTLSVPDGGTGILANGRTDIHISNGTLSRVSGGIGPNSGISFAAPNGNFTVEKVTIIGVSATAVLIQGDCFSNPIAPARVLIKNLIAEGRGGSSGAGVFLDCVEGSRIEASQIRDSWFGIYVGAQDTAIERNVLNYNNSGIYITGDNNFVFHNIGAHNTENGLAIDGGRFNNVTYNSFSFNPEFGSGGNGILLTGSASANTLDWNQASGNGATGINFNGLGVTGNVYSNNRALQTGISYAGNVSAQIDGGGNL